MVLNAIATLVNTIAIPLDIGAAVAHLVPSFSIGVAGFGGSPTFSVGFGGENIAGAMGGFAGVTRSIAGLLQQGAGMAATIGSYQRRQDEWNFQADLADKELSQLNVATQCAGHAGNDQGRRRRSRSGRARSAD